LKRYLSSPFFLIALIAFFLPFFAVTCAGGGGLGDLGGLGGEVQEATEVTGLELVTGQAEDKLNESGGAPTTPEIPEVGPSPGLVPEIPGLPGTGTGAGSEEVDLATTQILAIAAAAIALLGIFLSLIGGRAGGGMALGLGAGGAVLMFLLKSQFTSAITGALGSGAENLIAVENRMGFWLAFGGFIVAAVTGLVRMLLPDRPAYAAPPAGFGTAPGAPPGAPPPGPPPAAPPPAGP
jgi:hypothetical protein